MTSPTSKLRARLRLCIALGVAAVVLVNAPRLVDAQGLVKGVQDGAREGNKAAGPVGGVLGGAIGGVVGVVTGVTGVFTGNTGNNNNQQAAAPSDKDKASDKASEKEKQGNAKSPKATKTAKAPAAPPGIPVAAAPAAPATPTAADGKPVAVMTQDGAPQLTAEQIVSNSDSYVDRIKKELNLTPDQEKNWGSFASAMHYLGHNGAERLNLRIARAQRDPPDDVIEQMRNEAQFLVDRAADQRNVADAAEPLYASLDDKQKQLFIDEMVRLSHERGLD
ncbi:Spy/CpxP family protein refolding chaperone [Bradyrhizobium sp. Tv2a-2]|uniref:Spy/CpxP family protein refolding chaperone n=1 Tax=Bradyrhizobium sp. Tv2a-2 TaxID=113395 RepID=UPI000407F1E0|nr:Spy/CpxP family protein refolding chaperone [Bradyrhizobium sp. Tv2a-2]